MELLKFAVLFLLSAIFEAYAGRRRSAPSQRVTYTASDVTYTTSGVTYTTTGEKCAFPFVYRGKTYHECTRIDHRSKWCSTTSNYDGKWGHCAAEAQSSPAANGDDGYCTRSSKCGVGEGVCDYDFQCKEGLQCGVLNAVRSCMLPEESSAIPAPAYNNYNAQQQGSSAPAYNNYHARPQGGAHMGERCMYHRDCKNLLQCGRGNCYVPPGFQGRVPNCCFDPTGSLLERYPMRFEGLQPVKFQHEYEEAEKEMIDSYMAVQAPTHGYQPSYGQGQGMDYRPSYGQGRDMSGSNDLYQGAGYRMMYKRSEPEKGKETKANPDDASVDSEKREETNANLEEASVDSEKREEIDDILGDASDVDAIMMAGHSSEEAVNEAEGA